MYIISMYEHNPALMDFINGLMAGDEAFMGDGNRIHGLGVCFDVAGGRFAAVLLMIAFFLTCSRTKPKRLYDVFFSS